MSKASDKAAAMRALAGIQGQRGAEVEKISQSEKTALEPREEVESPSRKPHVEPELVNNKATSLQVAQPSNPQNDMLTNVQGGQSSAQGITPPTELKRFTTYLTPQLIKALKLHAVMLERDLYEVVRDAVERYLEAEGSKSPK